MSGFGTTRIVANLPELLREPVKIAVRAERHLSESSYGVALILFDVYCRKPHTTTGDIVREPSWVLARYAEEIARDFGCDASAGDLKTYRLAVNVPNVLISAAQVRKKEERYRSDSAYLTGLILYHLHVFGKDRRPRHERTAPLLKQPDWLRDELIEKIVADTGNPDRKWPTDLLPAKDLSAEEKKKESGQ